MNPFVKTENFRRKTRGDLPSMCIAGRVKQKKVGLMESSEWGNAAAHSDAARDTGIRKTEETHDFYNILSLRMGAKMMRNNKGCFAKV